MLDVQGIKGGCDCIQRFHYRASSESVMSVLPAVIGSMLKDA